MAITAQQVRELRERTGAPMMECKRALTDSQGDIDLAIEAMRKSGITKADKKAGRTAAEGIVLVRVSEDGKQAAILEVNSETDFVARDDNFTHFANIAVDTVLAQQISSAEMLSTTAFPEGEQNFEQARQALVAKIGENITLRRAEFITVEQGQIGSYVHGGNIGVLVHVQGGDNDLGKDLAMHIAASNPQVVRPEDFPEDKLSKEREIFEAKSQDSGKPAEIVEKIIQGQIKKFLQQVSLLGQSFVKDPDVSVGQLLKSQQADVKSFVRYEVGEGIVKEEADFAKEVMEQVRGSN